MTTEVRRMVLKPEEAATALGVGRDRIFALIAAGELRSIKIEKSRRIPVQAIEEYINRKLEETN